MLYHRFDIIIYRLREGISPYVVWPFGIELR